MLDHFRHREFFEKTIRGEGKEGKAGKDKEVDRSPEAALIEVYRKLRPGEPPTVENARALLDNFYFNPKRYDLAKVGRYKLNKKLGMETPLGQSVLTKEDIAATIEYLALLHLGETVAQTPRGEVPVETDDIDHFGNRRLRTVGELIQNQIRKIGRAHV